MAILLEYGDRRFQVWAYHDAIRHDGPALELAGLVHGELGPALGTVLFADDSAGEAGVCLLVGNTPARVRHRAALASAFLSPVADARRNRWRPVMRLTS